MSRTEESFWPTPLFRSQLVKDGEDFLRKKAPLKNHRVLDLIGPHHNKIKEAPTGNAPMGAIPPKALISRFPQVGGNRTTEALEVVFNPIQGNKDVETPLPNDSLQASLSPPVGHLRSFRRDWLANKCSDVLNIVTNGYDLPFISKPNLVRAPLIQSEYKVLQKDQAVASCVQSLLSKNAIERVENVKSLGFYSRVFLVSKPHQRWRTVKDLSRLNTFLLVERFKMETPESIRTSDSRGMGVVDRPIRRLPSHPHPPKLKEVQ